MSEPQSSRRILLVAYFYPPSRDTGVLRPAAMAENRAIRAGATHKESA